VRACTIFRGSYAIARKSVVCIFLTLYCYGEIESSNEVADFEVISARYKLFIAYFGIKV
tara:strand:+ start:418 stop:594 length:177 start_codon:yes stop_codon:yes gene_type:complete